MYKLILSSGSDKPVYVTDAVNTTIKTWATGADPVAYFEFNDIYGATHLISLSGLLGATLLIAPLPTVPPDVILPDTFKVNFLTVKDSGISVSAVNYGTMKTALLNTALTSFTVTDLSGITHTIYPEKVLSISEEMRFW